MIPRRIPESRVLRYAACMVGIFGVAVAAITVPYILSPGITLEFDEDSPFGLSYVKGVYPPERDPDGLTFIWAGSHAELLLPPLPRSTEWTLYIRGRGAQSNAASTGAKLLDGNRQVAVWSTAPARARSFAEIFVNLPPSSEPGLHLQILSAESVRAPGDPRELAVMLDSLTLMPLDRTAALPWQRVLLASGALVAVTLLISPVIRLPQLFVGSALSAVAVGLLLHKSALLYLPAFTHLLWGMAPVSIVLALGTGFRWIMAVPATAGPALAITCWFTFVKYLLLTHPAMVLGDAVFHQNRASLVAGGQYLFTSAAPGGEFPYPVAFYVIANLLAGEHPVPVHFLRGFALACDSLAGLLLAFATASVGAGAAPLAAAFWQTSPALYQVHGVAYLTNSFGNSMSVASLALLTMALRHRRTLGWVAAAIACASTAFLAHVSSFMILASTFVCIFGVAALKRRRRTAVLSVAILLCSLAVAWTTYYRHFMPVFLQKAAAIGESRGASVPEELPVQRLEAHQTMYVPGWPALRQRLTIVPFYLQKYIGFPLLALAAVMFWSRRKADDDSGGAGIVAAGWLLAVLGFFVLGQLTTIDVRYYLGAAPLVAAVAAVAAATILATRTRQDRLKRAAVLGLSAAALLQGCHYMARFLSFPLPR